MEVTGKVVIPPRKWGIKESGQIPWRGNAELNLPHALFEVSKTDLGEVNQKGRNNNYLKSIHFRLTMCQAEGHNNQADAVPALLKCGREKLKSQYQSDMISERFDWPLLAWKM